MKRFFFLFLFTSAFLYAQKPILYGDLFFGGSRIPGHSAWLYGLEANYQNKNLLYSFRYTQNYYQFIKVGFVPIGFTAFPFPVSEGPKYLDNYALLLGYRKAENGFAYSFSGGVSYTDFKENYFDENNVKYTTTEKSVGFPFEANIAWFKKEKSPYRIYGIIPVGKPSAIGNSIGFKLLGNISKDPYVGLALVWGIGIHQKY